MRRIVISLMFVLSTLCCFGNDTTYVDTLLANGDTAMIMVIRFNNGSHSVTYQMPIYLYTKILIYSSGGYLCGEIHQWPAMPKSNKVEFDKPVQKKQSYNKKKKGKKK